MMIDPDLLGYYLLLLSFMSIMTTMIALDSLSVKKLSTYFLVYPVAMSASLIAYALVSFFAWDFAYMCFFAGCMSIVIQICFWWRYVGGSMQKLRRISYSLLFALGASHIFFWILALAVHANQ